MTTRMQRLRWAHLHSGGTRPAAPSDEPASLTERIDYLALLVSQLPDREPTEKQRTYLRAIARELLRRAAG